MCVYAALLQASTLCYLNGTVLAFANGGVDWSAAEFVSADAWHDVKALGARDSIVGACTGL